MIVDWTPIYNLSLRKKAWESIEQFKIIDVLAFRRDRVEWEVRLTRMPDSDLDVFSL